MYWLVNLTNTEAECFMNYGEAVEALELEIADGFYTDQDFSIMDEDEYDEYINKETEL